MLEKREQKIKMYRKLLFVESLVEEYLFECFKNSIKILDHSILSCFINIYKDESRISFEELSNLIKGDMASMENKFVTVSSTRFSFFKNFGDKNPEITFGFKDLREVYFHIELMMIKITYISRTSVFELSEKDIFLICANQFDYEKWFTMLLPLVKKYINNDQIVLGNKEDDDDEDKSINKEVPVGFNGVKYDDYEKFGIEEDEYPEVEMMIDNHVLRSKKEINKIFYDLRVNQVEDEPVDKGRINLESSFFKKVVTNPFISSKKSIDSLI